MVFSMTLLVWMMRGNVMTEDWVHGVGHSPVCQILLQIVVWSIFVRLISHTHTSKVQRERERERLTYTYTHTMKTSTMSS